MLQFGESSVRFTVLVKQTWMELLGKKNATKVRSRSNFGELEVSGALTSMPSQRKRSNKCALMWRRLRLNPSFSPNYDQSYSLCGENDAGVRKEMKEKR